MTHNPSTKRLALSQERNYSIANPSRCFPPAEMSRDLAVSRTLFRRKALFGRVFGDPLHRTQCIWATCSNSVPKESRINAAILLHAPIDEDKSHESILSTATKFMLCEDCRDDRWRIVQCTQIFRKSLQMGQEATDEQFWHSTLFWRTSLDFERHITCLRH